MEYQRKQQEIQCENCKLSFKKDLSEIKRNLKLNRKNYCSQRCAAQNKSNFEHLNKIRPKNSGKYLNPSNRLDEFTLFREHLRRANRRKHNCTLTLEEMKDVWEKQKGICVYSKVKLTKVDYKNKNNPIYTMSLDRINSSIGYIHSNIQFISVAMNHLKNSMTHKQMLEMLLILSIQ